ncbi:unnamed protein product, partial [Ectocarpus fasciculatus]
PYRKICVLGLILFSNNCSIWMIFSYLPFMVLYFFPDLGPTEVGYRCGLLGSAFSLGSLAGNFIWGATADTYGRRPTLMFGLIGTACAATLFGFAPNFYVALLARFAWGMLNGNIGIAKTYMGEISNNKNSAKGMAIFGTVGGLGRTIGPVVGGFLSEPADHYPFFRGGVFDAYPFALPSVVIVCLCSIALITAYTELAETLSDVKPLPKYFCWCGGLQDQVVVNYDGDMKVEMSTNFRNDKSRVVHRYANVETSEGPNLLESSMATSSEAIMNSTDLESNFEEFCADKTLDNGVPAEPYEHKNAVWTRVKRTLSLFCNERIFLATTLYGILAFTHIITAEVFPLWLVVPTDEGGFGFSANKIGLAITVSGPVTIFTQLVIYPRLVKCLNTLTVFRLGIVGYLIVILFVPSITMIEYASTTAPVIIMTASYALFSVFIGWSYVCVFVFVNNSCLSRDRATVNALGQSCASIGRMLGPYFGGNLFAYTASSGMHWPLNYALTFYVTSVFSVYIFIHSWKLPDDIVNKLED